jgi:hypothetical protein
MATKPTVGGSDGTWGTELNAYTDVSLDADGKVDDGAAQTTSAAPTADAELANKKYVDDQIHPASTEQIVKGWARVSGAGADLASYNVTSTSKLATGQYRVTWDTDFSSTGYAVVAMVAGTNGEIANDTNQLVGSVDVYTFTHAGAAIDRGFNVMAMGAQ